MSLEDNGSLKALQKLPRDHLKGGEAGGMAAAHWVRKGGCAWGAQRPRAKRELARLWARQGWQAWPSFPKGDSEQSMDRGFP